MIKFTKIQLDLRSYILIVMAMACMSGILLDSWLLLPQYLLLIGAAIAVACIILSRYDSRFMLTSFAILWLLLGAWRFAFSSPTGDPQSINSFIDANKPEIRGTVVDDPKMLDRSRLLLVAVNAISLNNGSSWQQAHGQIEVQMLEASLNNPYGPSYGDSLEMQGKVQPPFPVHAPDVLASMSFPRLSVVGSDGNPLISALLKLRLSLASLIVQSLPQPVAALLIAILLSLQTPAIQPLTQAFKSTGTAHLIAPSGFKVTLLAGIVAGRLGWLHKRRGQQLKPLLPAQKREGYWRQWLVTSIVILCIVAYSILSGAGPAAQRACIMGIILVIAPRFGRIYNVYTAMALAVIIMCAFDPFVLWNAGFQLSTIGTLGIVVLTPLIQRMFRPIDQTPFASIVTEMVAITLAAEIATLPIFAFSFNQISLIAVLANTLTVPLLGSLISLGILLCIAGSIALPLGILCGWIIYPLLKYIIIVVSWCSLIPWAFLSVSNFNPLLAWYYYALLILIAGAILHKWPGIVQLYRANSDSTSQTSITVLNQFMKENNHYEVKNISSIAPRAVAALRYAAITIVILAMGSNIIAAPSNGQLSITLLNVGPLGKPPQGEAILIHTIDDKTILIDGGPDATSLAQELDSRLPFWQRSIDTVILTSPRQDHLVGAQDAISRFQVGQVLDAGMLHPSTGYALWKRTIHDRNIPYSQVREDSSIPIGTQASIQVLWPPKALHKGTTEELDNTLVARLVAPHFSLLLLGSAALSSYALNGLLSATDPGYLKADIVQVIGEMGKSFPLELKQVLEIASPSLLLVTPAAISSKRSKEATTSTILPAQTPTGPWQLVQTSQVGSMTISTNTGGWNASTE